jgi:hypothetical protein
MKMSTDRYTCASFLLGGGACTLFLVNYLLFHGAPFAEPLIPGFGFLAGLAMPVLCFWVGMLLRGKRPSVRRWIQGLVAAFALFCMCMYVSPSRVCPGWWSFLYVAVIGVGFLFPPHSLARAKKNPGWEYLLLFAVSAFSYTAISVSLDRVRIPAAWSVGFEDMSRLLERLLIITEPLLILLSAYFAGLFSFSRAGQWLGSRKWFRWVVVAPCLFGVIVAVRNLVNGCYYCDILIVRLIQILIQPVTVWLVVVIRNAARDHFAKKNGFNPDNV